MESTGRAARLPGSRGRGRRRWGLLEVDSNIIGVRTNWGWKVDRALKTRCSRMIPSVMTILGALRRSCYRRWGVGSRRSRMAMQNTGRRRWPYFGQWRETESQGGGRGRLGFFQEDLDPVWLGEGIRGGGSGWLGLALALDWWLQREGKESRHLRALSLEKMTIVELLSTWVRKRTRTKEAGILALFRIFEDQRKKYKLELGKIWKKI
jgi:hypothetical protein